MFLSHTVRRAARVAPRGEAAVSGALRVTWPELENRIACLARGLRDAGCEPGDRIGIFAANSLGYLELLYAAFWAGLIAVPFNARLDSRGLGVVMRDAEPKLLFADSLTSIEGVIPMSDLDTLRSSTPLEPHAVADDDLALLVYTGGTTGDPKGVMITHDNLFSNTMNCVSAMGFRRDSRFLHAPPLFHIGAISAATALTAHAGTHVFMPGGGFDITRYLDSIEAHAVTDLFLVPTMISMIARSPQTSGRDLSRVRSLMYGGSPITLATLEEARATFPNAELRQFYGMTEVTGSGTWLAPEDHDDERLLASAGKPLFTVDLRIVDASGRELPAGERGEIVIRSRGVMKGYWRRPDLTAEVLVDGAMATGDIGIRDEDGYVFVVDRKKDVIISGGENVYSTEIDRVIAEHPAVAQVATVGIPHPKWGEAVHAVIVLRPGHTPSTMEPELTEHCRARLAGFQSPRSFSFREELPINRAGKILKHVLREELKR